MEKLPKQYLYHMVPENMRSNEKGEKLLYPLNELKEKFPDLYELHSQKYKIPESGDVNDERKTVMEKLIPTLENAVWGDMINLTAIHPTDLKKALVDAGFEHTKELKFYQIDPALLSSEKTTIYLYRDDVEDTSIENFESYDAEKLEEHSVVPRGTHGYYKNKFENNEHPLLFVGVPHVLHKGPIDVSNFEVISTEMPRQ